MEAGTDTEYHLGGCCCTGCAAAVEWNEGDYSSGGTDSLQPVEQNAGGTSYSTSTATADGTQFYDALLSGTKWNTLDLSFSFPDSMSDYEYSRNGTLEAMNTAQKAAALYTFDLIGQYTNVRFTEFTGSSDRDADIRLAEESSASTAYAYYPSSGAWGGDIWFNSTSYNAPTLGNYAFSTVMHEIGHAMGLKHGHESSFLGALPYEYDSNEYSVMTYRSYVGSTGSSYSIAPDSGVQTFMTGDIAALQFLYGANFNTQSGDTTYSWDTTTGQMSINGVGQLDANGSKIFRSIWDGNGTDTYDFSNFTTNMAIDLRPGEGTDVELGGIKYRADLGPNTSSTFNNGYAREHVWNALQYNNDQRSLIENAKGGAGSDIFTGNAANNVLWGNGGNDIFHDSAGSDTYHGGAGTDEVIFGGKFSSYSFKIGASFLEVIGSAIDYVYDTVERLLFSDQPWDYAAIVDTLQGPRPEAVADGFSVVETTTTGLVRIGSVLANDKDSGGKTLSVTEVNGQSASVGATITLASGARVKVEADGSLSYDQNGKFLSLNAGQTATDQFTYTVTNGSRTSTATASITVDGVDDPNRAPVTAADIFRSAEGASVQGNVLANDSDPDGDALRVTAVNGGSLTRTLASGATVAMNADGSFTYQQNGAFTHLKAGQTATETFTYTATDGKGASSTATATITIDGADDPNSSPVARADTFRGQENATIQGNVLTNDSDPDGDAITVTAVNGGALSRTLASGATVRMNADGTFTYEQNSAFTHLNAGQTASETFTYTVSDGNGATSTATATITIDGADEPNSNPVAIADAFRSQKNATIQDNVLVNDSDPDGDAITVIAVNGGALSRTLASGATVRMNADGTFTHLQNGAFTHLNAGQTATDSFTYTMSNGRGNTATATVKITIEGSDTTIFGDDGANRISGTTGNDILHGQGGHDFLFGGEANDTLYGGAGNDVLQGGAGADRLEGGDGIDRAQYAGATAGVRADLAAPHTNTGEAVGDTYVGVEDLHGSRHADTLLGDGKANRIWGADGNDILHGQGGNDMLFGGAGNDTLSGGAGNDVLEGGAGADRLEGGDGIDRAQYAGATAGVRADLAAPHTNTGEAAGDTYAGIEDLNGSRYADTLLGDDMANRIWGADGNDVLSGQGGNDKLNGGAGNDVLHGGAGSDILDGGAGADRLEGGDGIDRAQYAGATTGVRADLAAPHTNTGEAAGDTYVGVEDLQGSRYADTLLGDDLANRIWGAAGNDVLFGQGGNDKLDGGAGNDVLHGGAGNDVLNGGVGNDVLAGGAGRDVLVGGGGADRFVFSTPADSPVGGGDVIRDFSRGVDVIDLRQIDASITLDGDQAFNFIGTGNFSNRAGELRFADGRVTGDVDGDGRADFQIDVTSVSMLSAEDFFL